MNMKVQFPQILAIDTGWNGNPIRQLSQPQHSLEMIVEHHQENISNEYLLTPTNDSSEKILAISDLSSPPKEFNKVLKIKSDDLARNDRDFVDLSGCEWIQHPEMFKDPEDLIGYTERLKNVINSWQGAFSYLSEDRDNRVEGLRPPQIGAVHATHAHWTVTDKAATIVMPTGTGKTETMLSILISKQCEKLLIAVPTDPLRTQIAGKFLTLGVLKDFGIVSDQALYPVVGVLKHKPKNRDEVDTFFGRCNVVVTTMDIAGQCGSEVQEQMAHHCPFLFIDEAHHLEAATWKKLKQKFHKRKVLQFTATPFRNDDKPVEGKVIFNYPLSKAQKEGYFKHIHFKPVRVYDSAKVDQAIADMAVKQLREDLKKYDHIIMARVNSIKRAEEVFSIYAQYAEFNPILIHSKIKPDKKKEQIRQKIINKESRIVVCVDMFGEGFDLPELKIAAFHDIRKSIAVTLQLAGRFTRPGSALGDPTFIANLADIKVEEKLRKLYRQDSDWNFLLKETSEEIIQEKVDLQELVAGFQNPLTDISLQNLRPAMSTVIYRTECENWKPEDFEKGLRGIESFDHIDHTLNTQKNTLVIVTGKKIPVDWAQSMDIFNWDWNLYILFWDKDQGLLFIHSSNNSGYYEKLAEAVAGNVGIIRGVEVFRCFSGVHRLKLQNVGLIEQLGRLIRFIMRAGSDIEAGLTEAQKQHVVKSNIFGSGYENGQQTTIGCSYKERIWARRKTNLDALRKWCSAVGRKVLDQTIDPDEVLKGTLVRKPISQRPQKMPVCIAWPRVVYEEVKTTFSFIVDSEELPLFMTDIELINPSEDSELKFEIRSGETNLKLKLTLFDRDYRFSTIGNEIASVSQGKKTVPIEDFFYSNSPMIWFVDGSSLEGNNYTELRKNFEPYPKEKIQTWNWGKVDIKKETQGIMKAADSIQYRVISELKKKNYDVIFDDDGSGEAADVVCIQVDKKVITVEFYHCKFSQKATPGGRIDDLYTVCGQAQKSIHWKGKKDLTELFDHLFKREAIRERRKEVSRFEKGNQDKLWEIREKSRSFPLKLKIFIVQPGLSKSEASIDQLRLLSVTETYLMEICQLPFGVIASD